MSDDRARAALEDARAAVFWNDNEDGPDPAPRLDGPSEADLTVIGGGFTGLWTAIQALEDQPGLRVTVLEGERCGFGASSRNGGFCDSSLTHGLHHGLSQWPRENGILLRLGGENLDAIEATVARHGIHADFHRTDDTDVATEAWQVAELEESAEVRRSMGDDVVLLDGTQMQARVHSPTYLGGLVRDNDFALVDPARLGWGLRSAAESLGATVHEHSAVGEIERAGDRLVARTDHGAVRTDRVVMATNAYPGPVRRPRRYVIPVYDHVLMTEPLTPGQQASIGWQGGGGISDAANQFHYYRPTGDGRILFGGYDASYHFNNGIGPQHDQSATHRTLAEHFFTTFPQLEGLRFSHTWGGPIATTTRFTAAWGTRHGGRLAWVAGYTGLGVAASRFGARVALDLVFGQETERTELEMVRKKPFPFPPEPLRWASVAVTRKAIQRADRNEGRRGPWLRLLDRFGVGFDS